MKSALRIFITFLFLLLPLKAVAQLPPSVIDDFKPVSGYVIMPIGEEYLIDLDATVNLHVGDILTLVEPGEKVIHPVTKKVLGTLDVVKGFLQVTRIKSGYSYAKLLQAETPPEKGAQVRRYEQVPATFTAPQGDAEQLAQILKTGLPQFHWLSEADTTKPLLTFTIAGRILSVSSSDGATLHSYPVVNGRLVGALTPPRPVDFGLEPQQKPKFLEKTVKGLLSAVSSEPTREPIPAPDIITQDSRNRAGTWIGPNLSGEPCGLAVADFNGDGLQEIAVGLDSAVSISLLNQGKYRQVATIGLPVGTQLLSLNTIDLDQDGRYEIYVTTINDYQIRSYVIESLDNQYQVTSDNIPWFLAVAELPEGKTLVGQQFDSGKNSFYAAPFKVVKTNGHFVKGTTLSLPGSVNIYSFRPFTGDKSATLFAYLTKDDHIKVVSSAGDELWESGSNFGGSESRFENRKGDDSDMVEQTYIPQRILQTPQGDLLFAQNEGIRTLQRYRMFQESRIVAMSWNGHALDELWRTTTQQGYLADFSYADIDNDGKPELAMIIEFKHKGFFNNPKSALVSYELH